MSNYCSQCGAPVEAGMQKCQYCGAAITPAAPQQQAVVPQQPQQPYAAPQQPPQPYAAPQYAPGTNPAINPAWPIKNKIVAGILALLLGSIGIHKFYLGKTGQGILMLIFCWTYIPAIIGFVEGLIILTSNDENFQLKYHCRLQ